MTNYGGTTDPSNFSFKVNDGKTTAFEDDGSNSMEVAVGTYNIVETDTPGYKTTYDNCRNIKVEVGSTENCYISNTAIPGTLTVNKTVDNQNGGTAVASDFSIKINDRDGGSFVDTTSSEGSLVFNKLRTGVYSVVENNSEGYSATYENCTDLRIGLGENVTCEITNSDKPALLHIIKTLIQDNGATDLLSDFSVKINDRGPVSFDSKGKIELSVPAGKYNVGEVESDAYKTTYKGCKVELKNGEEATCYITNDDNPANVTLYKKVINNNGGRKDALDFVLTVDGEQGFEQYATSGIQFMLDAGNYKFGEKERKGYENKGWLRGDCTRGGLLSVVNGGEYKCLLVNNDLPGRIIVHKEVINDNGGNKKAQDFKFKMDNGKWINFSHRGVNVLKVDAGKHTVTEKNDLGYKTNYKGCRNIKVRNGQTVHCYITNNDKAPKVVIRKVTSPRQSSQDFDFTLSRKGNRQQIHFTLDGNKHDDNVSDTFKTGRKFKAGWVKITEDKVDSWRNDSIECYSAIGKKKTWLRNPFKAKIGGNYYCKVYNSQDGRVVVTKFHDYNRNGEMDENEPVLSDWEMKLQREGKCEHKNKENVVQFLNRYEKECMNVNVDRTETTNENGEAIFENVDEGMYMFSENLKKDWEQTAQYCSDVYSMETDVAPVRALANGDYNNSYVYVNSGKTRHCYIGNYHDPLVEIKKSNNTTGPVTRGTEVTFTITVQVPGADMSSPLKGADDDGTYLPVTVTDLLTSEFDYVPGSFTANSDERGDLVAAGITSDPNYASPGSWILTSLASNVIMPGELVTLTYRAIIRSTTPAGNYVTSASVLGYGDTIDITAEDTDPDDVTVTIPAVLGESTTLASTGSNQYISIFSGLLLIGSVACLGRKRPIVTTE